MGRRVTVDSHPQREAIVKALITGKTSYQAIGTRFNIPKSTIATYVRDRLQPVVAIQHQKQVKQEQKEGDAFLQRIENTMVRVQKMYDACDEWLTDPNNVQKYTLSPRADEIRVIYNIFDGERRVKRSDSLSELIDRIERKEGANVVELQSRVSDPRKLLLETALTLNKQLELLAKIQGLVKDNLNVTINAESIYNNIIQVVSEATKDNPTVREAIIGELQKSSKSITG